jgi:hypothetical protein
LLQDAGGSNISHRVEKEKVKVVQKHSGLQTAVPDNIEDFPAMDGMNATSSAASAWSARRRRPHSVKTYSSIHISDCFL